MSADLHVHTTVSDGMRSPAEVVALAAREGLKVLAIADHDSTRGLAGAAAAVPLGMTLVPAAEWSAEADGREFHILGYGMDGECPAIRDLERLRIEQRDRRIERMVTRLRTAGVSVAMDDIQQLAGDENVTLTRAHLARWLVAEGVADGMREAFDRFLGTAGVAYVAGELPTVEEVISRVREGGGFTVWAHPPAMALDVYLDAFVNAGLGGVECWRPNVRPNIARAAARRCKQLGIVPTGGSDWHGHPHQTLGLFRVEQNRLGPFFEALEKTAVPNV